MNVIKVLRFYPSALYPRGMSSSDKKQWRIPWDERKDSWKSVLRAFEPKKNMFPESFAFFKSLTMHLPTIRKWQDEKNERVERAFQQFLQERHSTLGNDLAVAHFIVHRGGSVKFIGNSEWLKGENGERRLPRRYDHNYLIEAVDASNVKLYYEGLANFIDLNHIKWLSINNSLLANDWYLDYISGELQTLQYLDISNCKNITECGLAALYRLKNLKELHVHNVPRTKSFELTCLLLEDMHPRLKIVGVEYMKCDG